METDRTGVALDAVAETKRPAVDASPELTDVAGDAPRRGAAGSGGIRSLGMGSRRNLLLLAVAAAGFGVLQLATFSLREPFGSDETVYLSQFNPAVPDFSWGPQRAWGVALLGLPVALLNGLPPVARIYFVLLSSLGLFLAFRPWLAVRNTVVVPLAAGLFGTLFTTIYLARLDLPNYYTALGAVAATGLFLLVRQAPTRPALFGLAGTIAFTALVRPADSVWLAIPLGLMWLLLRPWRRMSIGIALIAGEIAGWLPWLIESFFHFDGPLNRLQLGSQSVGGSGLHLDVTMLKAYAWMWDVVQFDCRYGDGGAVCPSAGSAGTTTLMWWLAVAVLAAVGVAIAKRKGHLAECLVPLGVGLSLAFPYLFMTRYASLRFLVPAEALLALPIAHSFLSLTLIRRSAVRIVAIVAGVVLLTTQLGLQVSTAERVEARRLRTNTWLLPTVDRLENVGLTSPCLMYGRNSLMLSYPLRCHVEKPPDDYMKNEPPFSAAARAKGEKVVVTVDPKSLPEDSYLHGWQLMSPAKSHISVYLASG